MPIIDSQVHAYEANTPKRPWASVPNWGSKAAAKDSNGPGAGGQASRWLIRAPPASPLASSAPGPTNYG